MGEFMRSMRKVLKHLPLGRHSQGVGAVSAEKNGSAAPSVWILAHRRSFGVYTFWSTQDSFNKKTLSLPCELTISLLGNLRTKGNWHRMFTLLTVNKLKGADLKRVWWPVWDRCESEVGFLQLHNTDLVVWRSIKCLCEKCLVSVWREG